MAGTPDGVVEAPDARFDHPYFVMVQWQPEELDDAVSDALFSGLISAAAVEMSAYPW